MSPAEIRNAAERFQFHSFHEAEDDELERAGMDIVSDTCLLAASISDRKVMARWACDCPEELEGVLGSWLPRHVDDVVILEFIPPHFRPRLEAIGFTVYCEYVDFWLTRVEPIPEESGGASVRIRDASSEELGVVSGITRKCESQSRGFTVETIESLSKWLQGPSNRIAVALVGDRIVGHVLLSTYAFYSSEGGVVWIRELAADPAFRRRGIGRKLLVHGINWGHAQGAKRSFLACDNENYGAIQLYEKFGYKRNPGQGQLNMIHDRRPRSDS